MNPDTPIPLSQWGGQQTTPKDPNAPIPMSEWGTDHPDQSATMLGIANTFYSPLQNIQQGQGEQNIEHAEGAGKQALSDIESAGITHAGPVGAAIEQKGLAEKNPFAQGVKTTEEALKPKNQAQATGAAETQLAEAIAPIPALTDIASSAKLGEKTGLSEKLSLKRITPTADYLTKKELSETGRVAENGTIVPSKTEKRASELLKGKTFANPVKTQQSLATEISTRGKEAETFLEKNAKPISNEEDFNAFKSVKDSSEKYMTSAESNAYDEQIVVFQKILKGYGKYNTSNYYKALKEYESQVTANIPKGKDALLVPGGSARLQAAKDVRSVVRDMIGKKNPEFKGKMFDLASLYDVQDTVGAQVAEKAKQSTTFGKRHPILTKGAKYGAEAVIGGTVYEGAKKAGLPLPGGF